MHRLGFEQHLPDWFHSETVLGLTLWQWVGCGALAVLGLFVGSFVQRQVIRWHRHFQEHSPQRWATTVLGLLPGPLRYAVALLVFWIGGPLFQLEDASDGSSLLLVRVLLIITITWFASRLVNGAADYLSRWLMSGETDSMRRRTIETQLSIPRRALNTLVIVIGAALVSIQFDVIRGVGISLLASASVAGVVIGLAAQRVIGNLLIGLQLAYAQPIRLGDEIVVEGEWGVVEEITLSYVVLRIWDLRRLVLPVAYFVEKPIQNWTRSSTDLLGTVMVYADYTIPVDEIRAELGRILESSDLWDRKVTGLQVTNLTERGVELRALMSASTGGRLWDLRCLVREKLLDWLRTRGSEYLPAVRRIEYARHDEGSH